MLIRSMEHASSLLSGAIVFSWDVQIMMAVSFFLFASYIILRRYRFHNPAISRILAVRSPLNLS